MSFAKRNSRRILVIGIDGADSGLMEEWIDYLPNIKKLRDTGIFGKLRSTDPPFTMPAWPSFYTGVNPGKHGVFAFKQKIFGKYEDEFTNWNTIGAEAIWEVLSKKNKKSIIVNIPVTYPPSKTKNIIFVSGMMTPPRASDYTHPLDLKIKLDQVANGYIVDPTVTDPMSEGANKDEFLSKLEESIFKRTLSMKYLLKEYEWDLAVVVYVETDRVCHPFWKFMDNKHPAHRVDGEKYKKAILSIYQKIDKAIGELISETDENTTVILMSDHGFGPCWGEFNTNSWLIEKGYLVLRSGDSWREFLIKHKITAVSLLPMLRKLGLTNFVFKFIPKELIEKILPIDKSVFEFEIDWEKTKAFSCGHNGTEIYINLKGREENGIVRKTDYSRFLKEISNELKKIKHPASGIKMGAVVFFGKDIYYGKYAKNAPDLIFYLGDGGWDQTVGIESQVFSLFPEKKLPWSGCHRPDGFFLLSGKGIKKINRSKKDARANILDLAPTILYLLGLPLPSNMDGKVLVQLLETEKEIKYAKGKSGKKRNFEYTTEDKDQIKQRLKELGYI